MNQSFELAIEVNTILSEYIAIHNDILGGTLGRALRRIIPIPGIFKKIDFCDHEGHLDKLAKNLAKVLDRIPTLRVSTPNHDRFPGELEQYARALLETIQKLQGITSNLCRKSQGAQDYTMAMYRMDLNAYKTSVHIYRCRGEDLNKLIPDIKD